MTGPRAVPWPLRALAAVVVAVLLAAAVRELVAYEPDPLPLPAR